MGETVWDTLWKSLPDVSLDDIERSDPYYRLLKRLLRSPPGREIKVLEVGSGTGARSLALAREYRNTSLEVVMVDISRYSIRYVKGQAEENGIAPGLVLGDAFSLPFRDGMFDIVWNEGVNEHFTGDRRQAIFDEMARVCKDGGELIVMVPNAYNLPYRLTKKILELAGKWEYGFERPYTPHELAYRMTAAGATPTRRGGAWLTYSLFTILDLKAMVVRRNPNRQPGEKAASGGGKEQAGTGGKSVIDVVLQSCASVCFWIDGLLEPVLGYYLGKDIGIRGIVKKKSR